MEIHIGISSAVVPDSLQFIHLVCGAPPVAADTTVYIEVSA